MATIDTDVRELDRRAVLRTIDIVGRVRSEDLARPTPCTGWRLVDLLQHMTAQHHGFAAAGQGRGAELSNWRPLAAEIDLDPVAAYLHAAQDLILTFQAEDLLNRSFRLPEISTTMEFSATRAVGFHFIDYVVHGWDVARSVGQEYVLDDDLASAALDIALAVPNGPERLTESSAFAPARPSDSRDSPLERILRALGRDPAWPHG
jgi:uncharacterized protein (TIGR03086 family)